MIKPLFILLCIKLQPTSHWQCAAQAISPLWYLLF